MKYRCAVSFLITALLLAGVFIYSTQRSASIYLNQRLSGVGDGSLFAFLQNIDLPLSKWIIYSLPDGLWMFALVLTVLLIWDFRLHRKSIAWLSIAFVSGLMFEILQGFHLIKGTFDPIDLAVILIAGIVPLSFILLKRFKCTAE